MAILHRKLTLNTPETVANRQREAQDRYYINKVKENPRYELLLAALSEGVNITQIAQHFHSNGWIDTNERTFAEALRVFRRKCPELIAAYKQSSDRPHLEQLVAQNQPAVDEVSTLSQLIRLQQLRLAIDVKTEIAMGKLFKDTQKDIEITAKLIETQAKIRGKLVETKRGSDGGISEDVTADLNKIKKQQQTNDRLHGLVKQLAETV